MNARVQPILNELRQRLETLYGPRLVKIIVYGSLARGDAEPGSDIDVLVVLQGVVQPGEEIQRTGATVAELSLRFNEVILGPIPSAEASESEMSVFDDE